MAAEDDHLVRIGGAAQFAAYRVAFGIRFEGRLTAIAHADRLAARLPRTDVCKVIGTDHARRPGVERHVGSAGEPCRRSGLRDRRAFWASDNEAAPLTRCIDDGELLPFEPAGDQRRADVAEFAF